MACYIVTYDLRVPGRDYKPVYEFLKSHGTWAKITESAWAIVTTKSAKTIRDELKALVDSNDRIFVVKSGVEAAWSNSIGKNEWFKKHL